jgi:ankyrin repeat protein
LLIAAGAEVNDAPPDGMSALVLAAHSGHPSVATLLLDKGADPNAAAVGYTALHAAVLRGEIDLVKVLLAHGARPNALITKGTPLRRNNEDFNLPATLVGATPYLLAAKFLEVDIMRTLAAGGADTRLGLKGGETPLLAAAGLGVGAQTDRRGLSVLDGGKLEGEPRVVEAVAAALDLGSDIHEANQAGDTALHIAAAQGYDRVVALLAERGANLNAKNARGLTPLATLTAGTGRAAAKTDPARLAHPSTATLLRTLGAVD